MNEAELLRQLADRHLTLGSCESVTGGLFGANICQVPGASNVYLGGLITYTAKEKTNLAGVNPKIIEEHGVVSAEVASAMAIEAKRKLGVDICVSCTGNAGPTQEEGEAGVGTVYLGLCYNGYVYTVPLSLSGERNQIRAAVAQAMVAFVGSLFAEQNLQSPSNLASIASDK